MLLHLLILTSQIGGVLIQYRLANAFIPPTVIILLTNGSRYGSNLFFFEVLPCLGQ